MAQESKQDAADTSDGLKSGIQAILGDMDKDGAISEEIAGILAPFAVTLEKMSQWEESQLAEYVRSLQLKSVVTYQRIPINEELIIGIKKLNPQSSRSNGMYVKYTNDDKHTHKIKIKTHASQHSVFVCFFNWLVFFCFYNLLDILMDIYCIIFWNTLFVKIW